MFTAGSTAGSARSRLSTRGSWALALLLLALLVTGCQSDDGDQAKDPQSKTTTSLAPAGGDAAPATGARMKGKGYVFRAPEGWQDSTKLSRQSGTGIDQAARGPLRKGVFRSSVTVGIDEAQAGIDLDNLEQSIPLQLAEVAPKIETLDRVDLDGTEAIHHRGAARLGTQKYVLEQVITIREERLYVITFSTSRTMTDKARAQLTDSVLASWRWR